MKSDKLYWWIELVFVVFCVLIIWWTWNDPSLTVMHPLRYLTTLIHEQGHVSSALLTGGNPQQFLVNEDQSGLAYTAGGNYSIILLGGYLGTAIFGSFFTYLVNRFPLVGSFLFCVSSVPMLILSVIWGTVSQNGQPLALVISLVFFIGVIIVGSRIHYQVARFVATVLTALIALDAVNALYALAVYTQANHHNDIVNYWRTYASFLPSPNVVAWILAGVSLVMFLAAFALGVKGNLSKK